MTDTSPNTPPVAMASKIIEYEQPSDLPEINWLWRRIFIFTVTYALLALVYWIVYRITDVGTIRMVAQYALILVGLFAMLYVAGASSEAITRLIGAIRTSRKETVTGDPGVVQ